MNEKGRMVVTFLITGVAVGVIVYFLFSYLLATYVYTGYPGLGAVPEISYIMATGFASGAFSILLLMYPIYKFGDRSMEGEDFR